MAITYEQVRGLFDYHEDGYLVWKVDKSKRIKKGSIAGTANSNGYRLVRIDGILYRVHRIIWLWHYGYLPENDIDHKDRVRNNNKIENLRETSESCNGFNITVRETNKFGVTGISIYKKTGMYYARIKWNYKEIYLGTYKSLLEAVLARYNKEVELGIDVFTKSSAYTYLKERNLV